MFILIGTGPLHPVPGNNASLAGKVVGELKKSHRCLYLSYTGKGFPDGRSAREDVIFAAGSESGFLRRLLWKCRARVCDHGGYADAYPAFVMAGRIRDMAKSGNKPEILFSTLEPFPSALAMSRITGTMKILYLMDPPALLTGGEGTPFRNRQLKKLLEAYDLILTTPFIRQALQRKGFDIDERIRAVGFPMIVKNDLPGRSNIRMNGEKINLLFCGWLYADIRSPACFLQILSRLDERFCVYFIGRECEKIRERFSFDTKADVVTLGQQPYETALDAMEQADILINIGNSVPVHMPSKTLEYINTGKPIVNFHKLKDCPTLYYTKRYPVCLNLYEADLDPDAAAADFVSFCLSRRGMKVGREWIEKEYFDCTPGYIAGVMEEEIGKYYG